MIASQQESYDKPRQCVKKQKHLSADKGLYRQGCGLPSGHWQLWELYCEESRLLDNWCLQTVMLEKTPESPLDSKIKPINPKGNKPWIFIGRTDAEAEAPVFWPPSVKSWLIGKDTDAGIDWGQEEKGMTEDEMVGWHHWLSRREFEQAPGVGDGQGNLECCSPWDHKESDSTERVNNNMSPIFLFISWIVVLSINESLVSVQLLSLVQLFVTLWTAVHLASLSITNSQSLVKLMSMGLEMPSNHFILCHPLLFLPSI